MKSVDKLWHFSTITEVCLCYESAMRRKDYITNREDREEEHKIRFEEPMNDTIKIANSSMKLIEGRMCDLVLQLLVN